MRRQRSLRVGIAAIGVLTLFAVGGVRSAPTEAAWTEPEYATSVVSAGTIVAPVIVACDVRTLLGLGLVFTGVTIRWTSDYDTPNVQLRINDVLITQGIERSGNGPYAYTATLSASLLQTLLGGLLGSSNTVTVHATYPDSQWQSSTANRTLQVGGLLGLLGANTCTA